MKQVTQTPDYTDKGGRTMKIIGAILAALVITLIAQGHEGYSVAANGLGQNGFGAGYNGPYTLAAALLFEFVATFLFVTGDKVPSKTM